MSEEEAIQEKIKLDNKRRCRVSYFDTDVLHERIAELEQRAEALEERFFVKNNDANAAINRACEMLVEKDERIAELEKLCKECADYLDYNDHTSIGHKSVFHTQLREKGGAE
jgi:hypothetical protein